MKTCDVCFEYLEDDNPCCIDFRSEMERLGYAPHWSGAEWSIDAYAIGADGHWLCDDENGQFTYLKRTYNDSGNDYFEEIQTFESASAALEWVKTITKKERV